MYLYVLFVGFIFSLPLTPPVRHLPLLHFLLSNNMISLPFKYEQENTLWTCVDIPSIVSKYTQECCYFPNRHYLPTYFMYIHR